MEDETKGTPNITVINDYDGTETIDCSICLNGILKQSDIIKINKCGHIFHTSCLVPWICTNCTCPNCRGNVFNFIEGYLELDPDMGMGEILLQPHHISFYDGGIIISLQNGMLIDVDGFQHITNFENSRILFLKNKTIAMIVGNEIGYLRDNVEFGIYDVPIKFHQVTLEDGSRVMHVTRQEDGKVLGFLEHGNLYIEEEEIGDYVRISRLELVNPFQNCRLLIVHGKIKGLLFQDKVLYVKTLDN